MLSEADVQFVNKYILFARTIDKYINDRCFIVVKFELFLETVEGLILLLKQIWGANLHLG